ncbi:MAG TPA: septum formation inhibitor Maf [Thiothrix sp.]|nr:septum formation inhibitor Maf [Thiothrix sp.]
MSLSNSINSPKHTQTHHKPLVLASQSPRRRELLAQLGLACYTLPVEIDESHHGHESPAELVARLAQEKAQAAAQQCSPEWTHLPILGADTLGEQNGELLVKPQDYEDAFRMLSAMSGQWHTIYSSVALYNPNTTSSQVLVNESRVKFRQISHADIHHYWQTGEPHDKAGAYAIQGLGAVFVERLEGSYSAVMGLALAETHQLLQQVGIHCLAAHANRQI